MTTDNSIKKTVFKMGNIQILHLALPSLRCFDTPQALDDWLKQAPELFSGMPLIISLPVSPNTSPSNLNTSTLVSYLQQHGLVPLCFESPYKLPHSSIPVLSPEQLRLKKSRDNPKAEPQPEPTQPPESPVFMPDMGSFTAPKIINTPVRSGQQIYARNNDLLILAQVSEGAEVLADGNIYAYAPIRGRAAAGILGNTDARIFTLDNRAEMLSIAGIYLLPEDYAHQDYRNGLQIWLDANGQLEMASLLSSMPESYKKNMK